MQAPSRNGLVYELRTSPVRKSSIMQISISVAEIGFTFFVWRFFLVLLYGCLTASDLKFDLLLSIEYISLQVYGCLPDPRV